MIQPNERDIELMDKILILRRDKARDMYFRNYKDDFLKEVGISKKEYQMYINEISKFSDRDNPTICHTYNPYNGGEYPEFDCNEYTDKFINEGGFRKYYETEKNQFSFASNHYNISVTNSPNANIVNHSQNVAINQNVNDIDINKLLEQIGNIVSIDNFVQKGKIDEIIECLEEIKLAVKNNSKPKFAIKSLISLSGDIASIASLCVTLGQWAGVLPPMPK